MRTIPALILTALLLAASASASSPHAREVVAASEILAKIERGEAVSIDNLIVEGDLNLSEIGRDVAPNLGAETTAREGIGIYLSALVGEVRLIHHPSYGAFPSEKNRTEIPEAPSSLAPLPESRRKDPINTQLIKSMDRLFSPSRKMLSSAAPLPYPSRRQDQ